MIKFILLASLVLSGHLGWWVFCYNRINATSLPRQLIKRMERMIIVLIMAIPVAMVIAYWSSLLGMIRGDETLEASPLLTLWSVWSIGCVLVLGPGWLESRMWLWPPKNVLKHEAQCVDVAKQVAAPVAGTPLSRALSRLPLNEITYLSVTHKTLRLERTFPQPWQELTIGHLSDLHFTGDLTPAYYHYVVERMQALAPDLIVISGDIIDEDDCLDWIDSVIGPLRAPLGCYFLFGNHERRLSRPELAAQRLTTLGWCDLGVHDAAIEPGVNVPGLIGRPKLILCGNERPWFDRHVGDHWQRGPLAADSADECLKIAVAHSPDQHPWARELGMDLLLAGHTHGGQVRVPLLGPLVAPSRFGSRFASGVFRLPPTIMHVSRGLSGTQPLRWRCAPEISLLTILPGNIAPGDAKRASASESHGEPSTVA